MFLKKQIGYKMKQIKKQNVNKGDSVRVNLETNKLSKNVDIYTFAIRA